MTPYRAYLRCCWWAHLRGESEQALWIRAYVHNKDVDMLDYDITKEEVIECQNIFTKTGKVPLFISSFARDVVLPLNLVIEGGDGNKKDDIMERADRIIEKGRNII